MPPGFFAEHSDPGCKRLVCILKPVEERLLDFFSLKHRVSKPAGVGAFHQRPIVAGHCQRVDAEQFPIRLNQMFERGPKLLTDDLDALAQRCAGILLIELAPEKPRKLVAGQRHTRRHRKHPDKRAGLA